ncbi:MAG: hypothetical protein GXP41_06675 [Chloroflexi bacterium]|nr:hypothetical protein [Chloroflexota bacterium]
MADRITLFHYLFGWHELGHFRPAFFILEGMVDREQLIAEIESRANLSRRDMQ